MNRNVHFLIIIFVLVCSACSSSSGEGADPLAEFRTLATNLRDMVYHQFTETGRALADLPEDATDEEKEPYVTALGDIYLSQLYCQTIYNNIIGFQILRFEDNTYTNTGRDMTIDVSDQQYRYQTEYFIRIEGAGTLEKVSAVMIYNPQRETWLFIGKRSGGNDSGPPIDYVATDLWIKQEGAVLNDTTYYASTIFHLAEENGGTTHTTNAIATYTGSDLALQMAGEHVACTSECIDETDTPIFTNGITAANEAWDDFKMTGITTIGYEISP